MALNSSGPISLAGTTAGQSIALELGLSTTGAISLNQTDVRTLAGVASGAITMPTNFWGKSSFTNFFAYSNQHVPTYNNNSANSSQWSSGASFVRTNLVSDVNTISVFNGVGNIVASRQITLGSQQSAAVPISVMCNDNSFYWIIAQNVQPVSAAVLNATVLYYNSSGVLQWQRAFGDGSIANSPNSAVVDSSNNLYFSSGNVISKINSSGTVLWTNQYSTTGGFVALAISSDSTKLVASAATSGNTVVIDSNGSLLRSFTCAIADTATKAAIDNAGNVYTILGSAGTASANRNVEMLKIDTSNAIAWRNTYTVLGAFIQAMWITPDGNYVYPVFTRQLSYTGANPAILPNGVITKIDSSSGVVQWQKLIQGPFITQRFIPATSTYVSNSGDLTIPNAPYAFPEGARTGYGGNPLQLSLVGTATYTDAQMVANSKSYTIYNSTTMSISTGSFGAGSAIAAVSAFSPTVTPITYSARVTTISEVATSFTYSVAS